VVVSARTGAGIEELLAAIEEDLPRPEFEVDAVIPYGRGDLIARIHEHGELLSETHLETGTRVLARVDAPLRAALAEFAG
jgi:GTP-binding protein HflX